MLRRANQTQVSAGSCRGRVARAPRRSYHRRVAAPPTADPISFATPGPDLTDEADIRRTYQCPVLRGVARKNAFGVGLRGQDFDDIHDDTWIRVLAHRADYDRSRPFAPWFLTIFRRECIRHLRAAGRPIPQANPPAVVPAPGIGGLALQRSHLCLWGLCGGAALARYPIRVRERTVLMMYERCIVEPPDPKMLHDDDRIALRFVSDWTPKPGSRRGPTYTQIADALGGTATPRGCRKAACIARAHLRNCA